jgi:threonine aldolase
MEAVETNIVFADITAPNVTASSLAAAVKADGVLFSAFAPTRIRFVTHYQVFLAKFVSCTHRLILLTWIFFE